jgi:hypothetical protein
MKLLTFAFVQLIQQEPGLYDSHPDYARRDSVFGVGENFTLYEGAWSFLIRTYNKITIENRLIKVKIIHDGICCLQVIIYVSSHTA